jgi:hypothetical protein
MILGATIIVGCALYLWELFWIGKFMLSIIVGVTMLALPIIFLLGTGWLWWKWQILKFRVDHAAIVVQDRRNR